MNETDVKSESSRASEPTSGGAMVSSPHVSLSVGLPRFSGEAGLFERFVEDFDIFGRLQRWDEDRKRDIFPLCLSGIARDAYDALPPEQRVTLSLTITNLKASFLGRTPIDCHMSLTSLKYDPSEPLDSFVIQLRKLVSRAFPGQAQDGLLFNHFLMALPDDYRVQVVSEGVATFDAAVAKVRNLNSALRVRAAGVRQLSTNPDVVAQLQHRIEELERRLEAAGVSGGCSGPARGHGGGGSPSRGCLPPGGREADGRRRCFACGRPGHIRSVCRHRSAVCYQCNETGHLAVMCRAARPSGN